MIMASKISDRTVNMALLPFQHVLQVFHMKLNTEYFAGELDSIASTLSNRSILLSPSLDMAS